MKKVFKKLLLIGLISTMAFSFSSCDEDDAHATNDLESYIRGEWNCNDIFGLYFGGYNSQGWERTYSNKYEFTYYVVSGLTQRIELTYKATGKKQNITVKFSDDHNTMIVKWDDGAEITYIKVKEK